MHLRIKKPGGKENKVEVWEVKYKTRFKAEEMIKTFEVDEIMIKKPGSNTGWSRG